MKKILLTMAALSAIAAAAPAAAQLPGPHDYRSGPIGGRAERLQLRIEASLRRGMISRAEAAHLSNEAWRLERLENQYARNGLNLIERNELERRYAELGALLSGAEAIARSRGAYGGGDPYGRAAPYGPDGDFGRGGTYAPERGYAPDDEDAWDDDSYAPGAEWNDDDIDDRNSDGADDREGDRDGSWQDDRPDARGGDVDTDTWNDAPDDGSDDSDDGYHDNGAPVDPRLETGPIGSYDSGRWDEPVANGPDGGWDDGADAVIAEDDARGGLDVGEVAPGGLGAVPPEYRGRYADGNGVYYRYDDGRVYQIESRTNVIRWVGELPY